MYNRVSSTTEGTRNGRKNRHEDKVPSRLLATVIPTVYRRHCYSVHGFSCSLSMEDPNKQWP